jgi:hypothetical protein
LSTVPAGTELCTLGAALFAGAAAGVRGVLKGCATPGFDVAAGAPEGERGVAVVEVSAVMGVERRRGVVVKARARAGVRRERQRVQIMVVRFGVVVSCWCVCVCMAGANGFACLLLWKFAILKVPKRKGARRRAFGDRDGMGSRHVMRFTSLPYRLYTTI